MTPPSSKSRTSDSQNDGSVSNTAATPPEETDEQRKAREEAEAASKAAQEAQEKDNEKRKGNLAKVEDKETYDPYVDPDVPDSVLADTIKAELAGSGESPTLKALREGKKEEEKKNDE